LNRQKTSSAKNDDGGECRDQTNFITVI